MIKATQKLEAQARRSHIRSLRDIDGMAAPGSLRSSGIHATYAGLQHARTRTGGKNLGSIPSLNN